MSAQQFEHISLARTPLQAFDAAVAQAHYDWGHSGYTGTIAEKPGYVFAGPVSSRHCDRLVDYFNLAIRGWDTDSKLDRIPVRMRPVISKYAEAYDDKWGPAVCFEITGIRAVQIKEQYGRKGTMDKVYVFLGWAST